ncbi:hypothetical protein BDW62DRAFT_172637 [Aspergillus aurantiobrunneus]
MLFLFSRADSEFPSSDPVPDGSSNKTTQVIIGVVVGGVAAIAITAGIIFFLIKKRKWDRLRQCEERLIDYQLTTGYSSKLNSRSITPEDQQVYLSTVASPPPTSTLTPSYPYDPRAVAASTPGQEQGHRPGPRARGMSAPASTTLSTFTNAQTQSHTPEAPPPAYQTLHPRYDPSRYSQISTRFSSSFEIPRSSTSTVAGNPHRNTRGLFVSGILPSHSHNHNPNLGLSGTGSESSMWFQQQQGQQYRDYQYQPGPVASGSGSGSNWPSSSGPTTTTTVSSESNNTSATGSGPHSDPGSGERGLRRPRPVLSRLITNL